MNRKTCSRCGYETNDDISVCPICGESLSNSSHDNISHPQTIEELKQ